MVSNVIGQNKKEEVFGLIKKIIRMNAAMALIICVVLNSFPSTYLSIYGLDRNFINAGIPVLRLVAFAMILMSQAIVWLNAVTGTGNSRKTFLIELVAIIFYCLYVYLALEVYQLSIFWGWMSEIIYWLILFILSYSYMRTNKWKKFVV